jgi:membrane protease YdiL (CAAX protease family)
MPTAPPSAPPLPRATHRLPAAWWAWVAVVCLGALCLPLEAVLRSICLAPWLEEAVLRWGVQAPLQRRLGHSHPAGPALLAALVFAALHMAFSPGGWDLLRAAGTALPAWWIGRLYQHQQRLLPCAAWHAGFNLLWLGGLSNQLIG